MDKENTEFGIVATAVLPDGSLSLTTWRNGVLVVKVDHLEPAFVFMREYLKLKKALEENYAAKIEQLEVKDQILQELKDAVTSGELDAIITQINDLTLGIDSSIAKVENTIQRLFRGITKDTGKIRGWIARLVNEHIEKIRSQLIGRVGN